MGYIYTDPVRHPTKLQPGNTRKQTSFAIKTLPIVAPYQKQYRANVGIQLSAEHPTERQYFHCFFVFA